MRYALISDIHANLPALEAVLADIASREDVGATYHLGDLVGYAPWPNEVIATLRDASIPGIAGNYDSTVATGYKHCGCAHEDPRQEELSHLSLNGPVPTSRMRRRSSSVAFRFGSICGPSADMSR